jgi:inosose dehydratase
MTHHDTARTSRRGFLQVGTAAALGLAASPSLLNAGDRPAGQPQPQPGAAPPDPFGGFTVGVQSYSFREFTLEQALQRIRDLGLHFVELYRGHLPITDQAAPVNAARALCFQYGITPLAFGVERFTKDHAANRRIFQFARALGVRYLSADPTPESFGSLDRLVREFDIAIAIHPHGPQGKRLHAWYSAEVIDRAVRNHDRRLGSCLDTGHLIRCTQPPFNRKLDPAQQVGVMGARNFGLHLKDHDNKRREDVVFGRGSLNVAAVLRALREARFQGYISIEYEANPKNPSPDITACLDVFRAAVRKLG